ncbi:MAG: YfcE family phosphodiesterase [Anaerolineae bacterium]
MKIAVLSDTHDNIWNLERLLPRLQDAGLLIFCGDLCAPFTLDTLGQGFAGPVHVTLGNNDGDVYLLTRIAARHSHVTLAVPSGEIEADGQRLAFVHEPLFAEGLAALGRYAAVFCGHSHRREVRKIGNTLLANPGEVMGRLGNPGCGIYDTATRAFSYIDI